MSNVVGPATLSSLALDKLRRFSHILGDIGSTPLSLIEDVLVECSAETLSHIETETAAGVCQRDLSKELWPLWYIHVKNEVQNTIKKNEILRHFTMSKDGMDPCSPLVHLVGTTVAVLDYKAVYQEIMRRKRLRLDTAGQNTRKRFKEEKDRKMSRCVKVIDPIPVGGRKQKTVVNKASTTTSLSQKLGIRRPQSHGMKASVFRRHQKSVIKKHRSSEKPALPTVRQLQRHTASQKPKAKPQGILSEASLFHDHHS